MINKNENVMKEKHPFMITNSKDTRIATYDEVVELRNALNDVIRSVTIISNTMTEMTEYIKVLLNPLLKIQITWMLDLNLLVKELETINTKINILEEGYDK